MRTLTKMTVDLHYSNLGIVMLTALDSMAITNAHLLGAMIKKLPADIAAPLIKHRVMPGHFNKASVLGLNSVLLESPESLTESAFAEELPTTICQGIVNNTVRINCL